MEDRINFIQSLCHPLRVIHNVLVNFLRGAESNHNTRSHDVLHFLLPLNIVLCVCDVFYMGVF